MTWILNWVKASDHVFGAASRLFVVAPGSEGAARQDFGSGMVQGWGGREAGDPVFATGRERKKIMQTWIAPLRWFSYIVVLLIVLAMGYAGVMALTYYSGISV